MLSLAGISWLKERMPQVTSVTLIELTLTAQTLGIVFPHWCPEHPWEKVAVSLQSKQSPELVQ